MQQPVDVFLGEQLGVVFGELGGKNMDMAINGHRGCGRAAWTADSLAAAVPALLAAARDEAVCGRDAARRLVGMLCGSRKMPKLCSSTPESAGPMFLAVWLLVFTGKWRANMAFPSCDLKNIDALRKGAKAALAWRLKWRAPQAQASSS